MFEKIKKKIADRRLDAELSNLYEEKLMIDAELTAAREKLSSIELKNGAEYEDWQKVYDYWYKKKVDILKAEAEVKKTNGERKDSKTKTIVYAVGTILSIIGVAALSLLYACIENVGSAGREAKTWLKEIWKNRPIFK